MKVKFSFEGDKYEDEEAIRTMIDAHKYKSILYDITQELRNKTKYAPDEEALKTDWYKVSDIIWDIIKQENVEL